MYCLIPPEFFTPSFPSFYGKNSWMLVHKTVPAQININTFIELEEVFCTNCFQLS